MDEFTPDIIQALGAEFGDEVEFLPRAQSNGKALALAYIDARAVMRRLDATVGPAGWSFTFDMLTLDGKMVRGALTVLGVTKCDAGEAGAEEEPLKSAVSDAIKRSAVHFGIGRYLYYLPRVWAPYDAQKRRFTETPRIDRGAVNHALALCGIRPVEGRQAPAVSKQVEVSEPEPSQPPRRISEAAKGVMQRSERAASELLPNGTPREQVAEGSCDECHSPKGKPHGSKCSQFRPPMERPGYAQ